MAKKTFTVQKEWQNILNQCTDEEAGKLAKAIFAYMFGEDFTPQDRTTELLLEALIPNLHIHEPKQKSNKIATFVSPTLKEVSDFFVQNGYTAEAGLKAWKYYSEGDWKDSKGNLVKNWKQKMRGVWFKEENKIQKTQTKLTMF